MSQQPARAWVIAGVDGCKGGWVAAVDDGQGSTRVEVFPTFAALLDTAPDLVVVDVPIGIMEATPRATDAAARELLKHRACCVFSAPYRPMLRTRSHQEACTIREAIDGKRCSRQAFEIFAKIAEVDAIMTPALQEKVLEAHPEVTFAVMRGGQPMEEKKKSRPGHAARLAALRSYFPEIDRLATARRPRGVGRDDLLDAYAMLWTARRVIAGTARRLPNREQRDERGLRAEMLA